ncbi:unnamed protein product [Rotaria socialis]|uniref:Uncharacterized protein n=1 Tax=Rotaria socialis TaxID=392032 RepID=A0A821FI47_9BILA|nr:unnamed protein product [Rotaria socialis]CAF4650959.1 unnamed protein product [Rotaria socialis]
MDKPVHGEETRAMGTKKDERIQRGGPSEQQRAFDNTANCINNSGSCTTTDHSNNRIMTYNTQINYIVAEPYIHPQQLQQQSQSPYQQSQLPYQQLQQQYQLPYQQLPQQSQLPYEQLPQQSQLPYQQLPQQPQGTWMIINREGEEVWVCNSYQDAFHPC